MRWTRVAAIRWAVDGVLGYIICAICVAAALATSVEGRANRIVNKGIVGQTGTKRDTGEERTQRGILSRGAERGTARNWRREGKGAEAKRDLDEVERERQGGNYIY